MSVVTSVAMAAASTVVIRKAVLADIEGIITVDREVSPTFFASLIAKVAPVDWATYGQDPETLMRLGMEQLVLEDEKRYKELLSTMPSERETIFVACDAASEAIVGYLFVVYDAGRTVLRPSLVMVSEKFRSKGVGHALFFEMWRAFPDAHGAVFDAINSSENPALALYKRQGFLDLTSDQRALYADLLTDEEILSLDPRIVIPTKDYYCYFWCPRVQAEKLASLAGAL